MGYTVQQKNKISKYCYRMNKACNQRNASKVSEYFNHLKYHVMYGGATPEDVNQAIQSISESIEKITNGIDIPKIQDFKKELEDSKKEEQEINNALNNAASTLQKDGEGEAVDALVSEVREGDTPGAINNLVAIIEDLKDQGAGNSEIVKNLNEEIAKLREDAALFQIQLKQAKDESDNGKQDVENTLNGVLKNFDIIKEKLELLANKLGLPE